MAHNRFAKMPITDFTPKKELPPTMILSDGTKLSKEVQDRSSGRKGMRGRPIGLSQSQVDDIIRMYVEGHNKNHIAVTVNCAYNTVLNIINKYADKIDFYKNQLTIQRDKDFRIGIMNKRCDILEKITEKDIESATLGMKTGSIMDLTKIKALEEGRNVDGNTINLNISTKSELIDFITRPNIKDNNIIEEEGVVDNNITTDK